MQVNGKVKARLKVPADITAEAAIATAKADPLWLPALEGKQLVRRSTSRAVLVNQLPRAKPAHSAEEGWTYHHPQKADWRIKHRERLFKIFSKF